MNGVIRRVSLGTQKKLLKMPLSNEQFLKRLAVMADPSLLCEILDLESEDIIERFEDVIEDRMDDLREVFDIDIDENILYDR